jgi:hypothetical protein
MQPRESRVRSAVLGSLLSLVFAITVAISVLQLFGGRPLAFGCAG